MNSLFALVAWFLLAVVFAMRVPSDPELSPFERSRLLKLGDLRATSEQKQIDTAPFLESLLASFRTILAVAFVWLLLYLFGTPGGFVYAAIGLVVIPVAFRMPFVCLLADRLWTVSAGWLTAVALRLKPLFRWLRARDQKPSETTLHSQDELLALVDHSPGVLSREERERLEASLTFDDKTVSEVMTPRSMIEAVPVGETLGPLVLDELHKTGHSRFPVYDHDLDHIVGTLYLHDLIDLRNGSRPAQKAMRSAVYFIRDDKSLAHALHGFLSTKHHLFVVVNSYRETVGLLSLEDVVEQLIGKKIVDEFDAFDDLRAVAEHNPRENNVPKGKEDV